MGSTLLVDTFLNLGINPLMPSQLMADQFQLLATTPFLQDLIGTASNYMQVALGLGFVIFVHELGHFLAAKTFGVRCDKFYVGFDPPMSIGPIKLPRTLGKFTWGETEYGIGIIPLGGYVKMLGQDDDPRQAEAEAEKIRLGESEDSPLDPRSFPAKPVWQRMIIISAGVVMNLIFAVILAAIAFWYGVPYIPTVAGGTLAGGPAWEAGVEPGDQIVSFEADMADDKQLRYSDFATGVVIRGLDKQDETLPLRLIRGDEKIEMSVTPTKAYSDKGFYMIGMLSPSSTVIGPEPVARDSFLAKTNPDLMEGDVIKAVNGEELQPDPRFGEVLGSEMTSRFQAAWRDTATLTVERPAKDKTQSPATFSVDLPPVPVKTLGIGFAVGPVMAIQRGSIAEQVGIQQGDVITHVNGTPVVDALRLPDTVAQLAGQEVTLTLERPTSTVGQIPPAGTASDAPSGRVANAETIELSFQHPPQAQFETIAGEAGRLTLGGIGVAFDVLPEVSYVDEAIAASSGIQVGDKLAKYHWLLTQAERKALSDRFTKRAFEPVVIDESKNIPGLFDLLQAMPEGTDLKLFLRRDGQTREASLTLKYADDWYWYQRGVLLEALQQIHQTDSLATAASLGLSETKRRFREVLNFLRLLVTGRIGANGLGGPLLIAQAASSEASNGVSRLLIFLTLLSANLAILNFLPIPALDGGHMVFLTAEAIRGRPVSEALQIRLTMIGVLGLLSLMAFVIVNDILRQF